MPKYSAGILLYRFRHGSLEVFLVHPGGPFWTGKERGAWSVPKGEIAKGEDPHDAARREFKEETGIGVTGPMFDLGAQKQGSNKTVRVWALENDCDPAAIESNTFSMEWPPKSGRQQTFPEVNRAAWFAVDDAREKMHRGQVVFIDRLCGALKQESRADKPGSHEP